MTIKLNQLGAIENSGPNTVINKLKAISKSAIKMDIAVAFITKSGLDKLITVLERVSSNGKVRILTGIYQGFTQATALGILLKLKKQKRDNLEIRISINNKFHYKMYLASSNTKEYALIGSSNLTSEGISDAGEFNVYLESSKGSQLDTLNKIFRKNWDSWSKELTQPFVDQYGTWQSKNRKQNKNINVPFSSLLKLLKTKGKILVRGKKSKIITENDISYWQDYVDGHVKSDTEAIIYDNTNWDQKKYDWVSTFEKGQKKGDKVLYYDHEGKWLSAVVIKDSTHVNTPDGDYFIAFKRIKTLKRKKINTALWSLLKIKGLIDKRKSTWSTRKISDKKWKKYQSILHK